MYLDVTKLRQIELRASSLEGSLEFYRKCFGWKEVPAQMSDYLIFEVPPHSTHGLSAELTKDLHPTQKKQRLSSVLYFEFATGEGFDEAQWLLDIESFGGRVLKSPQQSPAGRVCIVADPAGQGFGLLFKASQAGYK